MRIFYPNFHSRKDKEFYHEGDEVHEENNSRIAFAHTSLWTKNEQIQIELSSLLVY